MSETAERLMDLAEARIREEGYRGFSFRELAAEIGIKSASVHHFPTKAGMAAAVARRHGERFFEMVAPPPNETGDDVIAIYRLAFRRVIERDGWASIPTTRPATRGPWRSTSKHVGRAAALALTARKRPTMAAMAALIKQIELAVFRAARLDL